MSHDISIDYRKSGGTCRVPLENHPLPNYSFLHEAYMALNTAYGRGLAMALGEKGIHTLNMMSTKNSIEFLNCAINRVKNADWTRECESGYLHENEQEIVLDILDDLKKLAEEVVKEHPEEDAMWTVDWLDQPGVEAMLRMDESLATPIPLGELEQEWADRKKRRSQSDCTDNIDAFIRELKL